MRCALRAQPENIVERVHKSTTQFLYGDGCQQLSLQEAGLHPKPAAVNGKTPIYFGRLWIGSLESNLGSEVRNLG